MESSVTYLLIVAIVIYLTTSNFKQMQPSRGNAVIPKHHAKEANVHCILLKIGVAPPVQ